MSILEDTSIFVAIVQQGGFSHAAKHLGLSNGLVSRRISKLEEELGVTLIKRTTRQLHLTPEGELFLEHAERIQQELNMALSLIHSSAKKPKGTIRISSPTYFGRHYLAPIIIKFLSNFGDIHVDIVLTGKNADLINDKYDIVIRGAGYIKTPTLEDSSIKMKLLIKEKIKLYASNSYLLQYGEPKIPNDLVNHAIINYIDNNRAIDQIKFNYRYSGKSNFIILHPKFNSNDIESNLLACIAGYGIGKFTDLNAMSAIKSHQLHSILNDYDWGHYNLYAIYSKQHALPRRTRLLLDFITAHCNSLANSPRVEQPPIFVG